MTKSEKGLNVQDNGMKNKQKSSLIDGIDSSKQNKIFIFLFSFAMKIMLNIMEID